MDERIRNLFYPSSVCVVGASTKEKNLGYELLKSIKIYGYKGKLFPVNPKADEVLGYKCYRSIDQIEDKIDLAIIMVKKEFVDSSLDMLFAKGVKSIILITAGFKEVGDEGVEREKALLQKIKDNGARMVGPNCMGVINTMSDIKLNATFVAEQPATGKTGFFSQSGGLAAAILNLLRISDIRFGLFLSAGNKADINENDITMFWQEDENISTLTYYLESFVDGEGFIKPFIKGDVTKPAIIIKAGKTASGMRAASSHTGALSGEDQVVDAILKQFGLVRAHDLNELFNTAKGFENFPIPKGDRVAVITNAGGAGILCVDSVEEEGLVLTEFDEETKNELRKIVHPEGSVNNPVDTLPGGEADVYKKAVELMAKDKNVDAVISIFVEPIMVRAFPVVEAIWEIESEKPIVQMVMPLPEFWEEYKTNSKTNKPLFRNPEDPAQVLANMLYFAQKQEKIKKFAGEYHEFTSIAPGKKYDFKPGFIGQKEINKIGKDYNLPIIKSRLVKPEELASFDEDFYPVVVKGMSEEVVHKSEMDAVKLNIKSKEELIEKAKEIEDNFKKHGYAVEEFLIQQFVKTKHEVLVGGYRDISFGPIIMFGTGGKYVEAIGDTVIKSAYLSDQDVDDMINSTKMGKILKGVRGEEPADIIQIKEIIKSCAKMIVENDNVEEFDLNPLIVSEDNKIHAVDIRIKIK